MPVLLHGWGSSRLPGLLGGHGFLPTAYRIRRCFPIRFIGDNDDHALSRGGRLGRRGGSGPLAELLQQEQQQDCPRRCTDQPPEQGGGRSPISWNTNPPRTAPTTPIPRFPTRLKLWPVMILPASQPAAKPIIREVDQFEHFAVLQVSKFCVVEIIAVVHRPESDWCLLLPSPKPTRQFLHCLPMYDASPARHRPDRAGPNQGHIRIVVRHFAC